MPKINTTAPVAFARYVGVTKRMGGKPTVDVNFDGGPIVAAYVEAECDGNGNATFAVNGERYSVACDGSTKVEKLPNVEKIVRNAETILADFRANKAEIVARKVDNTGYMLIWKFDGASLFVARFPKQIETRAGGFTHAITFRDFDSAARYVRATQIRNGKDEHPVPIKVTEAREIALADIDGVIATMEAMQPK